MAVKKKNKYRYYVILQKNYGSHGWEDIEEFESNSTYSLSPSDSKELKRLKKEYRISDKAPQRVIYRKVLNK